MTGGFVRISLGIEVVELIGVRRHGYISMVVDLGIHTIVLISCGSHIVVLTVVVVAYMEVVVVTRSVTLSILVTVATTAVVACGRCGLLTVSRGKTIVFFL